jgi:hypothetical protein
MIQENSVVLLDIFLTIVAIGLGSAIVIGFAVLLDRRATVLPSIKYFSVTAGAIATASVIISVQTIQSGIIVGIDAVLGSIVVIGLSVGLAIGLLKSTTKEGAVYGLLAAGFGGVLTILFVSYQGLFTQTSTQPRFTGIVLLSAIVLPAVLCLAGSIAGAVGSRCGIYLLK